jgi:hypothetical protein
MYILKDPLLACFLYRPWLPIVVTLGDNFRIYESDAWSNRIRYPDPLALTSRAKADVVGVA